MIIMMLFKMMMSVNGLTALPSVHHDDDHCKSMSVVLELMTQLDYI